MRVSGGLGAHLRLIPPFFKVPDIYTCAVWTEGGGNCFVRGKDVSVFGSIIAVMLTLACFRMSSTLFLLLVHIDVAIYITARAVLGDESSSASQKYQDGGILYSILLLCFASARSNERQFREDFHRIFTQQKILDSQTVVYKKRLEALERERELQLAYNSLFLVGQAEGAEPDRSLGPARNERDYEGKLLHRQQSSPDPRKNRSSIISPVIKGRPNKSSFSSKSVIPSQRVSSLSPGNKDVLPLALGGITSSINVRKASSIPSRVELGPTWAQATAQPLPQLLSLPPSRVEEESAEEELAGHLVRDYLMSVESPALHSDGASAQQQRLLNASSRMVRVVAWVGWR